MEHGSVPFCLAGTVQCAYKHVTSVYYQWQFIVVAQQIHGCVLQFSMSHGQILTWSTICWYLAVNIHQEEAHGNSHYKPNSLYYAKFESRDCKSISFVCGIGDSPRVVFAWALNASGLHLPEDVGVRVGADAGINYLVVQIHYGDPAGLLGHRHNICAVF